MAERTASPNYLLVFAWLVVVTALEVGAVYLHLPKAALIGFLLATALVKATLVAMYFMHLKFEGRLIYAVALVPLAIAAAYLLLLFPDIVIGYWR